jgi:hypothetical protein
MEPRNHVGDDECFVIMHNMIVEDEHDEELHDQEWKFQVELVEPQLEPAS